VGGGPYIEVGTRCRELLESLGLQDTHYVIDIGAGSGRLANALRDLPKLRYLGTDVVPELLEFARKKCRREDWSFKQVDRIEIPEADGVADFVVFFSVLTHLTEKESYRYLQEAKRVLNKNGTIVASYLDPDIPSHARQAPASWTQWRWWTQRSKRMLGRGHLNQLLSKKVLEHWSEELNLSIEYVDDARLGQSVCTYRLTTSI
jgi:ubiquinone/menaquinone biosynthesis C-methylase UbiE